MLDESFDFNEETLTKKTATVIKKEKKEFEGVQCEVSFYFFKKTNPIRRALYKTVTHSGFEWFILVLIILSSVKLVMDTYIFDEPEDSMIVIISSYFDYFFTAIFAMESLLKALAFGFI